MSAWLRIPVAVALAAVLAVAALAIEPVLVGERAWPYGPLSLTGGAFTVRPGHAVDLDAAAEDARRALPDYVVVTDATDEPMLIIGREDGTARPGDLRRWRDASGLPLAGPEEIGFGRSSADWFSRERRTHDVAFAMGAAAIAATAVATLRRRRPALAGAAGA